MNNMLLLSCSAQAVRPARWPKLAELLLLLQWPTLPSTCGDNQSGAGPVQYPAVFHIGIGTSGHSPLHRCAHAAATPSSASGANGS